MPRLWITRDPGRGRVQRRTDRQQRDQGGRHRYRGHVGVPEHGEHVRAGYRVPDPQLGHDTQRTGYPGRGLRGHDRTPARLDDHPIGTGKSTPPTRVPGTFDGPPTGPGSDGAARSGAAATALTNAGATAVSGSAPQASAPRANREIRYRWCRQIRYPVPSGVATSSPVPSGSSAPPPGDRPTYSTDCAGPSANGAEHSAHGPPSSRPRSGSGSGAPAMPSGAPRGTPSIEERATVTGCACGDPMTSSAEA